MIYNLLTLGFRPGKLPLVLPKLQATIGEALPHGTLLGCFTCEFGVLNRVNILTGYEDAGALAQDRGHVSAAGSPFGFGEHLASFEQAAYAPLSFLPPLAPGAFGPFYEMRSYGIAPGGIPVIDEAWAAVYERRNAISPMLMVMASLDTAPQRMVHVWPYKTMDARAAARGEAGKTGIWPPKGGSEFVLSMQSEVFVATAFSPLS